MNNLEKLLQNYPDTEIELFAFLALEEQKEINRSKNKNNSNKTN